LADEIDASGRVPGCLFCRIVAGELHAQVVAESDLSFAFRDIEPQAPTHLLVVPRRHIDDAAAIVAADAIELTDVFLLAQEVARIEGIDKSGFRLLMNVGEDAQNSVGHLHLHVIGGRKMGWPPG
jgi:histidine triad (HIT) family protein